MGGGISDTSSSSDCVAPSSPPRPICLTLVPHGCVEPVQWAAWDLLSRPDGISVRRLRRMFARLHGPVPRNFDCLLAECTAFELFEPHRRVLGTRSASHSGCVFDDARRHPHAMVVPCMRPHPLGNPWPIMPDQPLSEVCRLSEQLMSLGGRPRDYGGIVDPLYDSAEADMRRESELARLIAFVSAGGSIELRCCASCSSARRADPSIPCHVVGIASAIRARVERILQRRPPPSATFVSYGSRSRQPLPDAWVCVRSMHVRRACPPADVCVVEMVSTASERMRRAIASTELDLHSPADAADVVYQAQPLAFAGVATVPAVAAVEPPAPFSHRRLERRPDIESLLAPFPVCNLPPVLPFEDPPPRDPPVGLCAFSLREIIPHNDLNRYRSWARRVDRSLQLAKRGDLRASRLAKPEDLVLCGVQPKFSNVIMDLTSLPFKPLLPSRWPDRPPSTDLRIRLIRRDFRSYSEYPDRHLRGVCSHGAPTIGDCSHVSYFAAPHGSAYAHYDDWIRQMSSERSLSFGRSQFLASEGLATWPQRCQPTSMVQRNSKWRLCHDMSWPQPGSAAGVESPNDADEHVMVIVFVVLSQFCSAIAIFLAAGLPVKLMKFDLSKAYKRLGQQSFATWRRTCWSEQRSQTLDRICFGQRDGPVTFSRHSTHMVYIMRVELAYAQTCYPSHDPAVVAFLRFRLMIAREAGVTSDAAQQWASLSFLIAMLDDFGLAVVDYPLFRVDGSVVRDSRGTQRTFAFLALEVCESVVARFGHGLDRDDPAKYALPCDSMILLGGNVNVRDEELSFDPAKRSRYLASLQSVLVDGACSASELTSLAFRLLCVCECYPLARPWVSPLFRALRGARTSRVQFHLEPDVAQSLQRFVDLLSSGDRLAVPLACRQSFPFADVDSLLVYFADASSREPFLPDAPCLPGFGAWTVRDRTFYYFDGLWSEQEVQQFSVTILEFLVCLWAPQVFIPVAASVSHILEFTDNTGAEWSMRRETPSSAIMQRIAARRSSFLASRLLFARSCRVSSSANTWADDLSRQRRDAVLAAAAALNLSIVELFIPDSLRDTSWLLA